MKIQLVDCETCGTRILSYHLVKGGFKLCDNCNMQQNELNNDDSNNATHVVWFEKDGVRTDVFMGSEDMAFEQFFNDYCQLANEDDEDVDIDQSDVEEAFFSGSKEFKTNTLKAKVL